MGDMPILEHIQSILVKISLFIHPCVYLGLVFKYSLLHKKSIIKHYHFKFNHVVSPIMDSFIFPNTNSTLNILFIQVFKYQQMKINTIHCKGCIVTIFDGPGIRLEKFNSKNTVVTISFQCLIYVQALKGLFVKNMDYTSILPEIKVLITKYLHHFTYNGVSSTLCLYGGFAVFNEENLVFKKTFSSCKSHIYDSRSFYSKNSSLLLILYMHEQYSSINISFTISTVKCKPV